MQVSNRVYTKFALIILLLSACCFATWLISSNYYHKIISKVENANIIVISKQDMMLNLIDYKGDTIFHAPIAAGKGYGNKQKEGDMRTPEGVFSVVSIEDASDWTHDFNDGKGEIKGAYGDYFIRLLTPGHTGIGIHGTHAPESIGTRASEGCIRLRNEDLNRLVTLINPPLSVVITPSVLDESENIKSDS